VVVPRCLLGTDAIDLGFVGFYITGFRYLLRELVGAVFKGVEENEILEACVEGGASLAIQFTKESHPQLHRNVVQDVLRIWDSNYAVE